MSSKSKKAGIIPEFTDNFEIIDQISPTRIDVFLSSEAFYKGLRERNPSKKAHDLLDKVSWSRSYIKRLAKKGAIKVSGEYVEKAAFKVKKGDRVEITVIEDDYIDDLVPEKMDLDIEYEDENVMYINKKSGMVVHPGAGNPTGTLANGLLWYLNKKSGQITEEFINEGEFSRQVGLVHRLDKDTSGGILVAKNKTLMSRIMQLFKERKVDKYYLAVCYSERPTEGESGKIGYLEEDKVGKERKESTGQKGLKTEEYLHIDVVEKYLLDLIGTGKLKKLKFNKIKSKLSRNPRNRMKMAVTQGRGRISFTEWSILGEVCLTDYGLGISKNCLGIKHQRLFLLVIKPKTGRLHQIRAHLKYENMPILGDPLYGKCHEELKFMFLHSFYLGLPDEIEMGSVDLGSYKTIPQKFYARIPFEWSRVIKGIKLW